MVDNDKEEKMKLFLQASQQLIQKYNVKLVVRSSMSDAEGTIVKEES